MPLPVVILAAGQRARLRPLPQNLPKALIVINGEPFLSHQLKLLRSRAAFGIQINYGFDSLRPLRTAGADGLMTAYHNDGRWDVSNVEFDGRQLVMSIQVNTNSRMRHVDYALVDFGMAAFEARVPEPVSTTFQDLLRAGRLAAREVPDCFCELGSFRGVE